MASQPQFVALADALSLNPEDAQAISDVNDAISSGAGQQFFRALIARSAAAPDEYTAIDRAMIVAEKLIDVAPNVAEYLMLKIYGAASPLSMHPVDDAVENWLAVRARPELAVLIRTLANEEPDALVKKRMLEWADSMS